MIELTTEQGRKLAALSQQLRLLHTELADQSTELRSEQLRDEVQRAVSALAPQEREGFLRALKERFPIWSGDGGGGRDGGGGGGGDADGFARAARTAASKAAEELNADPRALANKLVAICQGMGDFEKSSIMAILSQGGLLAAPIVKTVTVAAAAAPVATPVPRVEPKVEASPSQRVDTSKLEGVALTPGQPLAELKRALGVSADSNLDGVRVVELASMLTEFVVKLEPWACQYWKDMAPDARNEVPPTLARTLGKYASNTDEKVTKEVVARETYRLRSLVSLLMKGVREAGKQYARDHLTRFGLDPIVKESKAGFAQPKASANWEQYVKLMEGVDANWIEQRIKKLIASDVDAGLSAVVSK